MGAGGTLLIYATVGLAVAAWWYLARARTFAWSAVAAGLGTFLFWPIFVPFLLARTNPAAPTRTSRYDDRIRAGEARLERALASLDGVAEDLLAPERPQVRALGDHLRSIARRAEEMCGLLATEEFDRRRAEEALAATDDECRVASLDARLRNIARLERLHAEAVDDLENALVRVEEIGSQMVLLRFVEDPDREALRLLEELAITVEGATEGLARI